VLIKTLFLVPIRDNDGKVFPKRAWRELEDRLRMFGGFTRLGLVEGEWTDAAGRIYRDRSRQYGSVLSVRDLAAWLAIVTWVQERFGQEAMYVEIAGQPEIVDFREGP
jgi:hypothetical protein